MVSYRPSYRKGRINSVENRRTLSFSLSRSVDSGRASEVTGREREDSVFGATPNIYLASAATLFGNASTVFIGTESQFPRAVSFRANDPTNDEQAFLPPSTLSAYSHNPIRVKDLLEKKNYF